MSLIAWYPLNGDTLDYSGNGYMGNAIGTLNISNDGKIGKTYTFSNDDNGVNIANKNFTELYDFTMCAWICPAGNHRNYDGAIISSGNWNSTHWAFSILQNNSGIKTRNPNIQHNYSFSVGSWYHVVLRREGTSVKSYVNGVEVGSSTSSSSIPLVSGATNTNIGRETYASGHFSFNGKINDVRIYNHALSDKEILDLSKAKILHYKFDKDDTPRTNLVDTTVGALGVSSTNYTDSTWGGHKTTTRYVERYGTPLGIQKIVRSVMVYDTTVGTGGGASLFGIDTVGLIENTTYTVSMYWKASDNFSYFNANLLYLRWYRADGSQIRESGHASKTNRVDCGGGWYRFYATVTSPAEAVKLKLNPHMYPNKDVTYYYFGYMLEKSNHMGEFTLTGDNVGSSFIYDSSGYDNDNILSLSKTPRWVKENPVGVGSYLFSGAQGMKSSESISLASCNPTNELTLSAWVRPTAYSSADRAIVIQKSAGFYLTISKAGKLSAYWYGKVPEGYHDSNQTIPINVWSMITAVWSSTKLKLYINGVLDKTLDVTGNGVTKVGSVFVGAENLSNRYMSGNITDVRVYATALDGEYIAWLYKNRASLDNKGNLSARVIKEIGINRCPNFDEWTLNNKARVENGTLYLESGGSATSPYVLVGEGNSYRFDCDFYSDDERVRDRPVQSGLIAWVDGADGSGSQTTLVDRTGNGNDFTLRNFLFDGTDGWVNNRLRIKNYGNTVKNSVRMSKGLSKACKSFCIHMKRLGSGAPWYLFDGRTIGSNTYLYSSGIGSDVDSTKISKDGVLTSNVTDLTTGDCFIYIELKTATAFGMTIMGRNSDNECLDGEFYSMFAYDRALTTAEIKTNMDYAKSINRDSYNKYGGFLLGSAYYNASFESTMASNNYSGNGYADKYPLSTWSHGSWSLPSGVELKYMKMTISQSSSYTGNTYRCMNPSVKVGSNNANYYAYYGSDTYDFEGNGKVGLTEEGVYESNGISTVGSANGLIRWFKLGEDLFDYSMNVSDGIKVGDIALDGDSYRFSGGHVDCGQVLLGSSGSVCCWVRSNRAYPSDSTSTAWRSIVGKCDGGGTGQQGYFLDWYGNDSSSRVLRLGIGNSEKGDNVTITKDLTEWTHVCGTIEGGKIKLYVNGELVASKSTGIICQDCTQPLKIGNFFSSWDGWIRDVRIYNRPLKLEEVVGIYKLNSVTGMQINSDKTINVKNSVIEG